MPIVRYNPISDLQGLEQELGKFWSNGFNLLPSFADSALVDMYEENGKLVTEFMLPNFKKNEINVTADQGVLEVAAEHMEKEEDKSKRRYYYRESNKQYLRRVALPNGVKTDKVEAAFKDGVLKISMPAGPAKKTKQVAIK